MEQEIYSAFETHEFFGEFFLKEETFASRFPGKIEYSPEKGLILQYNIADSDIPAQCSSLVGILDNGRRCTLIGPFNFNAGSHRSGTISTRYGTQGFRYLVIGDFLQDDSEFNHCRFTFHHMQEFFYPQGHLDSVPYKEGILEKIEGRGWCIDLENRALASDVTNNLPNLIVTDSDEARIDFSSAFNNVKEKHPNENFLFRNSLEFLFKYSSDNARTINDIFSEISKISALFSIFMNKPTFPDEVEIYPNEETTDSVNLLASISLESRTVALAKSEFHHYFLPINRKKVDLSTVITKWIDLYDSYRVLSTTYQYETNFRTLHTAYSDVVLFVSNIEAVAKELEMDSKERYEGPINYYGSEKLVAAIKIIFEGCNSDDLGVNISNLRNELAHVGRPKKLIKQLDINSYAKVSRLLKLIVVSHLLKQLGIAIETIHEYQDKLI